MSGHRRKRNGDASSFLTADSLARGLLLSFPMGLREAGCWSAPIVSPAFPATFRFRKDDSRQCIPPWHPTPVCAGSHWRQRRCAYAVACRRKRPKNIVRVDCREATPYSVNAGQGGPCLLGPPPRPTASVGPEISQPTARRFARIGEVGPTRIQSPEPVDASSESVLLDSWMSSKNSGFSSLLVRSGGT